jgi:hypothetical protein
VKKDQKMETKIFKAGWGGNNSIVEIEVPVFLFSDENGIHYSFLPSLDLMGYGNTMAEAKASLAIVCKEYLEYTTRNKTLFKDLEKHGWNIKKRKKEFNPPDLATLLNKNEELNRLVSTRDYTKKNQSIELPAFA